MTDQKADYVLTDGREITFDFKKVSRKEWKSIFDVTQPPEVGDEILARVAGITLEELDNLSHYDYVGIVQKEVERARNPLTDPT